MNFSKIIGACSASKIESCNLIIAIDAEKAFDKTNQSPVHFIFFSFCRGREGILENKIEENFLKSLKSVYTHITYN